MKAKLAVTMGDPAGIGAEIIVKAFQNQNIKTWALNCEPAHQESALKFNYPQRGLQNKTV